MEPKEKALELIDSVKKATSYQYQEYAGSHYSLFEHDIEELKSVVILMITEIINTNPPNIAFWVEVEAEVNKL
jgi:hypothetical protein